jgi:hypothetical protein
MVLELNAVTTEALMLFENRSRPLQYDLLLLNQKTP